MKFSFRMLFSLCLTFAIAQTQAHARPGLKKGGEAHSGKMTGAGGEGHSGRIRETKPDAVSLRDPWEFFDRELSIEDKNEVLFFLSTRCQGGIEVNPEAQRLAGWLITDPEDDASIETSEIKSGPLAGKSRVSTLAGWMSAQFSTVPDVAVQSSPSLIAYTLMCGDQESRLARILLMMRLNQAKPIESATSN